jgi:hypothetical protein
VPCPHRYRIHDLSRRPGRDGGVELVCFDMDGVLTTGVSSWVRVHEHFGVSNEAALQLFVNGEIDDLEFIRRDVALWMRNGPVAYRDIERVLAEPPLMPGAIETVEALHDAGVATAIVSPFSKNSTAKPSPSPYTSTMFPQSPGCSPLPRKSSTIPSCKSTVSMTASNSFIVASGLGGS